MLLAPVFKRASFFLEVEVLLIKYLIAAFALALTIGSANASSIVTFDVFGNFNPPNDNILTVSGSLTVDEAAGPIISGNLVVPTFANFTNFVSAQDVLNNFNQTVVQVKFTNADSDILQMDFSTLLFSANWLGPNGVNMTAFYENGQLITASETLAGATGFFGGYYIGSIASATPLPAALPLFATGLGALGVLGWRRKRKNAAAVAAA